MSYWLNWLTRAPGLKLLWENLDMKIIGWLVGAVTLLAVSGCDWDRDHHRGGNYVGYYGEDPYHHYGHGEYHSYDRDRDWH